MRSLAEFCISHHGLGVDACLKLNSVVTNTLATHLILSQPAFSAALLNRPLFRG